MRPPKQIFRVGPWRSRGYLPHLDESGLTQHLTFRLADSLPRRVLAAWEAELASVPEKERRKAKDERIESWLDRGYGACCLKDDRIAEVVEGSLLHFDGERYRLLAWCVMPNHVHAVAETFPGHPLDQVVHSWKSYSATRVNRMLGRSGRFWQTEYYDRFIRDRGHLARVVAYVEHNPVTAGMVESADAWRWSSAWRREANDGW